MMNLRHSPHLFKNFFVRFSYSTVIVVCFLLVAIFYLPLQAFAQSHREVFQRFPHKRPEASVTPSKSNLVVYDAEAGYLSIKILGDPDPTTNVEVNFVLYKTEDGTKYYAYQEMSDSPQSPCKRASLKFYVQDGGEWRDVTGELLPSVRISEFYGQKNTPNLIDVGGIISYSPEDNKRGTGLGIDYSLPRKGTTIQATLTHRCETVILSEYKKLFEDCKFKTIELLWNKQTGWFLMGKKK